MISTNLISQTRASIDLAVLQGLETLEKPVPQRLSEWAERHFYLSTESSYVEGPWRCLSYQRELMDLVSNDDVREIWVLKGARVGYTKCVMAAAQYLASHKRRNGVIFQPTDADRDEFVKTEIEPSIRDNPELIRIFPAFEKKSKHNTLALKQFVGAALHLRGGKSAKNYRRLTVDYVILDELDGFDSNIEGEGPPHQLAARRTQTANFPKIVLGSTPHIKGLSMIEDGEERAEIRLRWHFDCPSCGHCQELRWGGKDSAGGIKWDQAEGAEIGEIAQTARYECESCGDSINHREYTETASKTGRWMTEDREIWLEKGRFVNAAGPLDIQPRSVGLKVWSGMNELLPWSEIVREWLTVQGDRKLLQGFVNLTLAEAWEEDGVEQLDHELMYRNRREHYSWEVPDPVNAVTLGIDVQDDRFELGWVGWGSGEESWNLGYKVLQGDLARPVIWDHLRRAIRDTGYRKRDGEIMRPVLTVIDHGGHYSKEVERLSREMGPMSVMPSKGLSVYGRPVVDVPKKRNKNGVFLLNVGTDTVKNLTHQRLMIADPGPGYIHWPVSDDFDQDYFRQFGAEKRVPKWTAGGIKRYVWDAEKRRNEAWDVYLLNVVAVHVLQQRFGLSLDVPYQSTTSPAGSAPARPNARKGGGYLGQRRGYLG